MSFQFVGTCIGANPDDVHAFEEDDKEITFEEFQEAVGKETIEEINKNTCVLIQEDWAVSFHRGTYQGKPTVMMDHSRIFHFYSEFS